MADLLDIYNTALLRVKEQPLISVLDTSRRAVLCGISYKTQRPALLRRHRWPFAIRRVVLAPTPPAPAFGWQFKMTLPADMITLISASPSPASGREVLTDAPDTYRIEDGSLLADVNVMYVLYVADVTETGRFDALFTDALACLIASDLANGLNADREGAEQWLKMAEEAVKRGRRANSIEQPGEAVLSRDRLLSDRLNGAWPGSRTAWPPLRSTP